MAGRITGLAAGDGYLFAGGANGGVFRKTLTTSPAPSDDGPWQPISDGILSLSTGDLEYHDAPSGTRPARPTPAAPPTSAPACTATRARPSSHAAAQFTDADRLGGTELESRGINKVRFDDVHHWAYAATTRGLWRLLR